MILLNYDKLSNKKLTFAFLSYHFKLLEWKKRKLKLGAITFEIKEITAYEFVLWEEVDIRYIRQDNTDEDEKKIENILKRFAWKWDFKNIASFILVSSVALVFIYATIYCWYCDTFPSFAFREKKYNELIKFSVYSSFSYAPIGFLNKWIILNNWLLDLLVDYCIMFDLLF